MNNIYILHYFEQNFKDFESTFSKTQNFRNTSLSIKKLLFELDVQKNTKILLNLNKKSFFL